MRIAGLCHQYGDGRVVTVCYGLNNAAAFGAVLVHETAHGFLFRMRSSGRIPSWMNEGVAEWVAAVVVPQADLINRRMPELLSNLRQTGSLGGDFFDDERNIQGWQYGAAVTLATVHALARCQRLPRVDRRNQRGLLVAGIAWADVRHHAGRTRRGVWRGNGRAGAATVAKNTNPKRQRGRTTHPR